MASLPEVEVPEEPPYNPEDEGNDDRYVKKPRVDTGRIFKGGKQSNEQKLSKMRKKPKVLYDNPMEGAEVSMPSTPSPSPEPEPEPVKMVIEEQVEDEEEPEPLPVKPASPVPIPQETIKKGKRKMSQKQLDALARGRANSLAKRQARAQTKKEIKSSGPVLEDDSFTPVAPKRAEPKQYLTKEDVKNISVEAITEYDAIRKQRKNKKKEVKSKHIADARTTQQINRVLNPNDMDYYGECFNISY